MSDRQYFASPVRFDCTADKDGNATFIEAVTTGGKEALEVGKIYVKTLSLCQGKKRSITVKIQGLKVSDKEQTLDEFLKFTRGPKPKIGKDSTTTGKFLDCDRCVPGFDFSCKSPQDGLPAPDPIVTAPHFLIDVTLEGFLPGDKVSGYMLLEVRKPKKV
jgi:hypothetical protein